MPDRGGAEEGVGKFVNQESVSARVVLNSNKIQLALILSFQLLLGIVIYPDCPNASLAIEGTMEKDLCRDITLIFVVL